MKKFFLKVLIGLISIVVFFAVFVQIKFSIDQAKQYKTKDFTIKELVSTADLNLGQRLYSVRNGCIECHGADLSGIKIMDNGPMGLIYGANITPYKLKDWTDEEIARAIRYGIHKTGRSLQFMPSFDYESVSIGDTAALIAYLRNATPVVKESHSNSFGPIVKMLSAFNGIPVMFPAKNMDLEKGFSDKPEEGPTIEFGKYLSYSCIGCHGQDFRGGKIPGGDPSWPEASNIRLGVDSKWTESNFREAILTGISPITKQKLRSPMPVNLLVQMNDDEIKAIWLYLSSLK